MTTWGNVIAPAPLAELSPPVIYENGRWSVEVALVEQDVRLDDVDDFGVVLDLGDERIGVPRQPVTFTFCVCVNGLSDGQCRGSQDQCGNGALHGGAFLGGGVA